MKKTFITDGNEVRNCDSNIAKMNSLEYIKYFGVPFQLDFKEYFKALISTFLFPFILIFYPIVALIEAHRKVIRAKKFVNKFKEG